MRQIKNESRSKLLAAIVIVKTIVKTIVKNNIKIQKANNNQVHKEY